MSESGVGPFVTTCSAAPASSTLFCIHSPTRLHSIRLHSLDPQAHRWNRSLRHGMTNGGHLDTCLPQFIPGDTRRVKLDETPDTFTLCAHHSYNALLYARRVISYPDTTSPFLINIGSVTAEYLHMECIDVLRQTACRCLYDQFHAD